MFVRRLAVPGIIGFALLALAACAVPGSYTRSTMNGVERTYRYDQGGQKILVYEVDAAGKLTVYDPNDNQAKQMLARQKGMQEAEKANAARMEKIRQAPKRKKTDPIYLEIEPIHAEIDLNDKQKKDIYDYFKKHFENDSVIHLVNRPKNAEMRQLLGALKSGGSKQTSTADVKLVITVSSTTVYGMSNNKLAEAKAMLFKAKVTSNWLPVERKAEEAGTLFQIPDATQRLSDKVKELIKQDIGQTIPADRSI